MLHSRELGMPPADASWLDLAGTSLGGLTFRSQSHKATPYRLEQSGGTTHTRSAIPKTSFESCPGDMDAIVALLVMMQKRCPLLQQLSQKEAVRPDSL